jgi:hypothetical protein
VAVTAVTASTQALTIQSRLLPGDLAVRIKVHTILTDHPVQVNMSNAAGFLSLGTCPLFDFSGLDDLAD